MRPGIVSAADAAYFPQIKGLIQSIRDCRPQSDFAIGVLNVGLEPAQVEELRASGITVAEGKWHWDFPGGRTPPRWYQGMTSRPYLPQHFPDFDLLIWIDADAWVQDWRAIEMLLAAGWEHGLAIVPEVHRAYWHLYRVAEPGRNEMLPIYKLSFPEELAERLARSPVINSGVFALRRDSPVWAAWTKWLNVTMKGQLSKMAEQAALNAAIYFDHAQFYPLPAWCNWVCGQSPPIYDVQKQRLIEPVLPFEPISIVHVTPRRMAVAELATTDRRKVKMPLEYLEFKKTIATFK